MTATRSSIVGLALVVGVLASAGGSAQTMPTEKRPVRFSAFAVRMQGGMSGRIEVAIERWTPDEERQMLLGTLTAGFQQDALLDALQHIKPRKGFLRTPDSLGWDIKYARENPLPDGGRQIVIVTDKPVSFLALRSGSRTLDYPFTLLELRMPANGKGEGRMLAQTAIGVKNGRLELENYSTEPVRLMSITEEKKR